MDNKVRDYISTSIHNSEIGLIFKFNKNSFNSKGEWIGSTYDNYVIKNKYITKFINWVLTKIHNYGKKQEIIQKKNLQKEVKDNFDVFKIISLRK